MRLTAAPAVQRPALRHDGGPARLRRVGLVAVAAILLTGGLSIVQGAVTPGSAAAAETALDVAGVQSLYTGDLVLRLNAERAARSNSAVPVPQLQVDPGLQADAQAWSAHLAAVGVVSDPSLPACTGPGGSPPPANQVCVFAANSGDSGFGYWPGDGSDGMDAEYMASAGHRQNMLASAYSYVGVGVTCSASRAWTVELFGEAWADVPSANARQATQNVSEGDPVPASPVVAGAPSGDPVYCPGQTDGPGGAVTATGGQTPYPYPVPAVPGEPNGTVAASAVGMAATADSNGYWVARTDGSVSDHGDAANYGSMATAPLNAPISHVVATADGKGYWLVAADGGIFAYGDAGFYGSMGGRPLNAPVVGIASDSATKGYWLVASDGGIFSFGAPFHGSGGSLRLNMSVYGSAATPDVEGYWLVAADGGIFAFGDAGFHGSAGALPLDAPIVGMAADDSTGGYWLVASDGGIFSYGAPFFGAG